MRAVLALARTVAIFSSLSALYAMSVAVFVPNRLSLAAPGIPGLRTDTMGVLSAVLSVTSLMTALTIAADGWFVSYRRFWRGLSGRPPAERLAGWALLVVPVYPTIGWFYILANSVSHPRTLRMPLTHLAHFPTERAFAAVCLCLAFLGSLAQAIEVDGWIRRTDPATNGPDTAN